MSEDRRSVVVGGASRGFPDEAKPFLPGPAKRVVRRKKRRRITKDSILRADKEPKTPAVKADKVPPELRRKCRWIMWKWLRRDGHWTKVPCNVSGTAIDANDSAHWLSVDDAAERYKKGGFAGIGFVLGDGIVGIDWTIVAIRPPGKYKIGRERSSRGWPPIPKSRRLAQA